MRSADCVEFTCVLAIYSSPLYCTCLWLYEAASPSVPVQYSHLTGPLVGAKREKFDVYWFIGPLCILRQVLTFDLTNKMLMHVNKNVV